MRIIGCLSLHGCRQYKLFALLIQAFVLNSEGFAGFDRIVQPSSVFGRGLNGVAMDSWENVWINPASLTSANKFRASLFYAPTPFGLPQLAHGGFIACHAVGGGVIGLGTSTMGFSLYREFSGSATFAYAFEQEFSFGVGIFWNHMSIKNYGTASAVGFDLGAKYSVDETLSAGMALTNVNGASLSGDDDIPRSIIGGFTLCPVATVAVNVDIIKEVRFPSTYSVGFEFSPVHVVTLRGGMAGNSSRLFGGISVIITSVSIEYGAATHAELGMTHSFGMTFGL